MRSIRFIVFLRLFLVAFLSFGLLAGIVYALSDRIITRFYIEDNSSAVRFISENIRSNYLSHLRSLDRMAARLAPFSRERAAGEVDRFLELADIYTTVHVYGADGELLLARKRGQPEYEATPNFRMKKDPGFAALADQVLRDGRARVADPFVSASGNFYQLYIAPLPNPPGRGREALVSGGIDLGKTDINYLIRGSKFGERNFIAVTDPDGNFMAGDGLAPGPERRAVQEAVARNARAAAAGVRWELIEVPGKGKYYLFVNPLEDLRSLVVLGTSLDRIEEKRSGTLGAFLVVLPIGLLLSFFMSLLLGDRLSKPLRQAIIGISRIREGDYSYRIGYAKNDEIGVLCGSIDELSVKIRKARLLGYLWSVERDAGSGKG